MANVHDCNGCKHEFEKKPAVPATSAERKALSRVRCDMSTALRPHREALDNLGAVGILITWSLGWLGEPVVVISNAAGEDLSDVTP